MYNIIEHLVVFLVCFISAIAIKHGCYGLVASMIIAILLRLMFMLIEVKSFIERK